MIIKQDFSLKEYNTFGIDVKANHFVEVSSKEDLKLFLSDSPLAKKINLILGGGSNLLLTGNLDVVLHINLKGKRVLIENEHDTIIEAEAGENWHELVLWAIQKNLGGIENMSLIPGNIGTAPMQNIGAYGVEIKDVFHSLDAVELNTGKEVSFTNEACKFGYRESFFKNEGKGKYIITRVRLKLCKPPHNISTQYGAIKGELANLGIENPTILDVSNAVIAIRKSKLPDPKELGNSGSFFKNPIIAKTFADKLITKFPDLPIYPIDDENVKVAAGWLIEKAGWKGYRDGDAGVHKNQALVLVNYGSATGTQLINLAHSIMDSVKDKFGIELIPEVNIIS